MKRMRKQAAGARLSWYLLIHQLPPEPLYLRAKIRQRLSRVGAVALKNAVYALPRRDECLEDLQWIAEEALAGNGEAYVCEAEFSEKRVDELLVEEFRSAREADYEALAQELQSSASEGEPGMRLSRARKRFAEIVRIDFFGAAARARVEKLLSSVEANSRRRAPAPGPRRSDWTGRTWVTRRGIHIDRIASAWFVRRFLDGKARFRFVDPKSGKTRAGEIRFDMVGGDFTHEGDRCTFETLIRRTDVADPALTPIAEIVHDIDIKDEKFGRPEAPGIERLLNGIVASLPDDVGRLERGTVFFDELYESFRIGKVGVSKEARK